ncbi:MAG: T9SS type A sorting domain-containing protein [Candidatus Cloacimonadota bacterium]|nr:T9SS type A sorting domain-containing protein [Candidatus Cloacimonadota bacterium]
MKKIITVVFILMVMLNISSLYSVTKTIDASGTGDYLTFGECFSDLVTTGITEPTNVEVVAGTYTESATLNGAIPGADANNTVHFYPVGGDVLIDGGGNTYAIGLTNTAWIYFEGFEMILDGFNEFCNGMLYVDSSTNIDISHNEFHNSGFVGAMFQNSQDIRFWNNFVYDTNAANISMAMCGIGANNEIWNNSFVFNYPYFGGMMGQPAQCITLTQTSANVHNNAMHKAVNDNSPMGSFGIINIELSGGLMADYYTADSFNNNCYYTEPGTKLFQVGFTEAYTDLTALNTAYGFAANSVFGDPMFESVGEDTEDLNITSDSSACFGAAAVPSRWFSDDIHYDTRTRWDIGADFITVPEIAIILPDDFTFNEDGGLVEDFTQFISGGNLNDITLTVSGNTEIIVDIVDLEATFSATENWNGTETLTFTINDNATRTIAEDVVDVIVTAVNDEPVLIGFTPEEFTFTVMQDSIIAFSVEVEDIDSDLNYEWFVNDEIQTETTFEFSYQFSNIGDFEIKSIAFDEEYNIETIWTISVEEGSGVNDLLPLMSKLHQNFPNPFNPLTTIKYSLKENADIRIDIFNIKGQRIMILVSQNQDQGDHSVEWNGLDDFGRPVSSGFYFYNLIIDNKSVNMKKCLLIK